MDALALIAALPLGPYSPIFLESLKLKDSETGRLSVLHIFPERSWKGLALLKAFRTVAFAPVSISLFLLSLPWYILRPPLTILQLLTGRSIINNRVSGLPVEIIAGLAAHPIGKALGIQPDHLAQIMDPKVLQLNTTKAGGQPWISRLFWRALLEIADSRVFEENYLQAWKWQLEKLGEIAAVYVFMDNEVVCIPILHSSKDQISGLDSRTLEALRMWYCWLRVRRGLIELLLPKRLVRIDVVEIKLGAKGLAALGQQVDTLELGRRGPSHIAEFERLDLIPENRKSITATIVKDAETHGLEFVTEWDGYAISLISLTPFVGSLIFAAVWIAVFVARDGANTQVVVQTAFTVASYIVTAGALLIALFAFLDSQSGRALGTGDKSNVTSWVVNNNNVDNRIWNNA